VIIQFAEVQRVKIGEEYIASVIFLYPHTRILLMPGMYKGAEDYPRLPLRSFMFSLFVPDTPERESLFPGKFIRRQTCSSALMGLSPLRGSRRAALIA
jgi:hypothetical protein